MISKADQFEQDWLLAKPFGLTDLRKQLSAKTKAM